MTGYRGGLLKALREQAGLSQSELADLVGASQVAIARWETSQAVPRDAARVIEALCRAIGGGSAPADRRGIAKALWASCEVLDGLHQALEAEENVTPHSRAAEVLRALWTKTLDLNAYLTGVAKYGAEHCRLPFPE